MGSLYLYLLVCIEPHTAVRRKYFSRNRQKAIHLQTANSHPPAIGNFGLKMPIQTLIMDVFGMGSTINDTSKSDILPEKHVIDVGLQIVKIGRPVFAQLTAVTLEWAAFPSLKITPHGRIFSPSNA